MESPGPIQARRFGFLVGECDVPQDFDCTGRSELAKSFGRENDPLLLDTNLLLRAAGHCERLSEQTRSMNGEPRNMRWFSAVVR